MDEGDELNVGETVADAIKHKTLLVAARVSVGSSLVADISNRCRHPVHRGFSYLLGYLSLILERSLLICSIDLIPPLPILQLV